MEVRRGWKFSRRHRPTTVVLTGVSGMSCEERMGAAMQTSTELAVGLVEQESSAEQLVKRPSVAVHTLKL